MYMHVCVYVISRFHSSVCVCVLVCVCLCMCVCMCFVCVCVCVLVCCVCLNLVLCVCAYGRFSGYVMKPALHPFWKQGEETCEREFGAGCIRVHLRMCAFCAWACPGVCVRTWLACAMC